MKNPEYLFHGSTTQDIKVLEPRKRYTPAGKIEYKAIYATPLPHYAAAHAFPWNSDEGVDLDVVGDDVFLEVPESIEDRLNTPVSIYKIHSDGFRHTTEELTGATWDTIKPVQVLSETKYPSVRQAFEELGGKLSILSDK